MSQYTYLKRVKIGTDSLKKGMYVAKLDKKWENSPFLFQGFPIEDDEQLQTLREECHHVYVDFPTQEEYKTFIRQDSDQPTNQDTTANPKSVNVSLSIELPTALKILKEAVASVKKMKLNASQNMDFDSSNINQNVIAAIDSIKRNQNALILALNMKDKSQYDTEHTVRVAFLSLAFGIHLGMSYEQLLILGTSGMLFDIGKELVPATILHKQGKLNKAEALVLRDYPKDSFRLLSRKKDLSSVVREVALSHHEREDGKGYPRNIPKNRVSRFAKLIAIVDTYDAITSDRAYRKNQSPYDAFKILNANKGTKFDSDLVTRFLAWQTKIPIGCLVEMETGEIGIIIDNNREKQLQPKIMLVADEQKKTNYHKMIDLSKMTVHTSGKPYQLHSILAAGSYGINVQDYLYSGELSAPIWNKKPILNSPFKNYL